MSLTDLLDLVGLLALVAAAAVFAGVMLGLAAALAVAGGGLLLVSYVIDRAPRRRTRRSAR
ncbi:hypothetical protein [Actinotalea sp. JY-7876]|uniref:hypothetical protein n=1 Tax=Actinotalea sp. JY-7876 TaxID=2758442 RepID=UPI0015F45665|nr:hypothetical protein [Actinotalea sp. JY-7876]